MPLDRKIAEGGLVDVLDVLNGNRVVGSGFRLLEGVIATACQCLPHPTGKALLPDPDAPSILVLVRVSRPGHPEVAAFGAVASAEPHSKLALLKAATAAGLAVPEELNAALPFERFVEDLTPAVPELSPPAQGPVFIPTRELGWLEGAARGSAISLSEGGGRLRSDMLGLPVFGESGRAVGVITSADEGSAEARMCLLSEHLPGWALRKARDREAPKAPPPPAS